MDGHHGWISGVAGRRYSHRSIDLHHTDVHLGSADAREVYFQPNLLLCTLRTMAAQHSFSKDTTTYTPEDNSANIATGTTE